jgi:hypothetical protein
VPPAVRGAALVGLAVIVGIVGLQILDDSSPEGSVVVAPTSVSPGSSTTIAGVSTPSGVTTTRGNGTTRAATSTTRKPTSTTRGAATTSTVAARPTSAVKVFVLNGGAAAGAASTMQNKLRGLGYDAQGADNTTNRKGSAVACIAGYEREAEALVLATGVQGIKVEPYPSPPPSNIPPENKCIVTLGSA